MMRMRLTSIVLAVIIIFSGIYLVFDQTDVNMKASGDPLYVGSGSTYKTINDAIAAATSGDTIYVANGTYYESVLIDIDNIKLIGNSSTDCKINHSYTGSSTSNFAAGINITAKGVTVTGFNISVSGTYTFGIYMNWLASNCVIKYNRINTTGIHGYGFYITQTGNNEIYNNTINTTGNHGRAFMVIDSQYNDMYNNTINTYYTWGHGFSLLDSDNNNITDNTIMTKEERGEGVSH